MQKLTLLFLLTILFASIGQATDLLSVKPLDVDFKKVPQGSEKKISLRLKTSATLPASISAKVDAPFTVDRTSFSMDKMAYSDLVVVLPASLPVGEYKGKLALLVSPIGIDTSSKETIEIPLHATVVTPIPDFSISARIASCKPEGRNKSCEVEISAANTMNAPASVHTVIAMTINGKDKSSVLDRAVDFQQPPVPFIYTAGKISSKARQLTLLVTIDPESQVQEENETNNFQEIVLDIP